MDPEVKKLLQQQNANGADDEDEGDLDEEGEEEYDEEYGDEDPAGDGLGKRGREDSDDEEAPAPKRKK